MDRKTNYLQEKGFSLTEIVVTVGIMGVLSAIAGIAYLDYLNRGRLAALEESARNFFKAAEVCAMVRGEDLQYCNTKEKLKFRCDDCSAVQYHPGQAGSSTPPISPRIHPRLTIEIKSGDCGMCVTYSPTSSTVWAKAAQSTTIKCYDWKFCSSNKSFTGDWKYDSNTDTWSQTGIPVTNTRYLARRPFERCSADSDCKTGEKCHEFPRGGFAVGGGRGKVCN